MFQQGDIISVWYPFSDNPKKGKVRPAIIISNEASNQLDHDLLIIPITSTLRQDAVSFPIDNNDLTVALPEDCEARCNKITTIRDTVVYGKVSSLARKTHRSDQQSLFLYPVKRRNEVTHHASYPPGCA